MNLEIVNEKIPDHDHDVHSDCPYSETLPPGTVCPEAKRAADQAVKRIFFIMGVDVDNPVSVSEYQAEIRFNHNLSRLASKGIIGATLTIIAGLVSYLLSKLLD